MATNNERKTENIVRNELRELQYYEANSEIIVEEQKSDVARLQKLLEHASKKGDGIGKPEFIIRSTIHPSLLIVIECKASTRCHVSKTLDQYANFAVDGVLACSPKADPGVMRVSTVRGGQGETRCRRSDESVMGRSRS